VGDVKMTDAAASLVQNQFNDLSAEFDNSRAEVKGYAADMTSACGEFSAKMESGAGSFDISWQDAFAVCSTSAALIAGNTNGFKVDLDKLDQDTRTTIVL
jgi:hypothetical protein